MSMKKNSIYLVLIPAFILMSCGGGDKNDKNQKGASGGVYKGGVLRVNEVDNIRSLFPLAINEKTS